MAWKLKQQKLKTGVTLNINKESEGVDVQKSGVRLITVGNRNSRDITPEIEKKQVSTIARVPTKIYAATNLSRISYSR